MIISFSGIDGSGKSYTAKKTVESLIKKDKKAIYVYLGKYFLIEYFLIFFRYLRTLIGFTENNISENKNTNIKYNLKEYWPLITIPDMLCRYVYLKILSLFGYIVVCDRYFYDWLAGFCLFGRTNPFVYRIFKKTIVNSDLAFYLKTDYQIASRREIGDQHNVGDLKKLDDFLSQILSVNQNIHIINTDVADQSQLIQRYIKEFGK